MTSPMSPMTRPPATDALRGPCFDPPETARWPCPDVTGSLRVAGSRAGRSTAGRSRRPIEISRAVSIRQKSRRRQRGGAFQGGRRGISRPRRRRSPREVRLPRHARYARRPATVRGPQRTRCRRAVRGDLQYALLALSKAVARLASRQHQAHGADPARRTRSIPARRASRARIKTESADRICATRSSSTSKTLRSAAKRR